ncbi:MAG TPA: rhomboid family intramembrane serine protease [Tepidisphaeraceae bacterium]|nr:rhomboid family intramembrane serine protease [Tepidisphaeraceae bacterium]
MIETLCSCGSAIAAPEAAAGRAVRCGACNHIIRLAAAEAVTPETALGDFDARLVITGGPVAPLLGSNVGDVIALAGVPDLTLGKSEQAHVRLDGTAVSRLHAKLVRIDFGPSRWKLVDTQSRNGVFVNGHQITERELHDGDIAQIGEYKLKFTVGFPGEAPAPIAGPDVVCSSCGATYAPGTVICTTCGINIKSGRPLVTSKDLADDEVTTERTDKWIRIASYFCPPFLSFMIIPVASEAFATHKPRAIWWITGITVVSSVLFFLCIIASGGMTPNLRNLMLWVGSPEAEHARIEARAKELEKQHPEFFQHRQINNKFEYQVSDRRLQEAVAQAESRTEERHGEFQWYQLFTHALLHGGLFHLLGNLVFLIVFGLRVNEVIGDLKMAIIYPILAVLAGGVYALSMRNEPIGAMLGASGAIMGLAGMYFIFFPVQRVHLAVWLRIWVPIVVPLTLFFGYKIFRVRGFWLLLLWILINDVLPTVRASQGDHVAHWAHLGGFMSGMAIALILLLTRQIHAHGGDILSVTLGSRAWALIGTPEDRAAPPAAVT